MKMVKLLSNRSTIPNRSFENTKLEPSHYDSGLFSLDGGIPMQSATQRIAINSQRIELLNAINSVLGERHLCEERSKDLKTKLRMLKENVNTREQHITKTRKDQATSLRLAGQSLEAEFNNLSHQVDHTKSHLEGINHLHMHCLASGHGHGHGHCMPCLDKRVKSGPSKKANTKMAAQRLVKDISELQHRVCAVEIKVNAENKIKKQLENEIRRFKSELGDFKKKRSMYSLNKALKPLPPLSKLTNC